MLGSRAQSTLEYIMSYGWAIIIVLLIVGALFELGAFSGTSLSSRVQPGLCMVTRSNPYGTTQGPGLSGDCTAGLPEYTLASVNPVAGSYLVAAGPSLATTNGSFSVMFWMSTAYPNTTQIVIAKPGVYGICFGSAGITLSSKSNYYTAPFISHQNQWYFVAVTYNDSNKAAQIYVNGSNIGSATLTSWNLARNSSAIYMAGIRDGTECGTNVGLTGLLANIQVYGTALDQASVEQSYLTGIGAAPVQLNSLLGWWPLNGNGNDYSGNNNTAIEVGRGNNFTAFWTTGYKV
jgi:hypothetical protein